MIKGIQHSSYTVSNLDEALHFFCDLMGLQAAPTLEPKGDRLDKLCKLSEPSAWRCCVLRLMTSSI